MQFPIFIHKEQNSDFGITVPDLPGCFSASSSMEESIAQAKEAIECHIEGLLIDGQPIPKHVPLEEHLNNKTLVGAVIALVEVDISKLSGRAKRINITLPERVLKQIDLYSKSHYFGNRSAFLADAAMNYMTEH